MPLFTLQRERRTFGYCSRQRFVSRSSGILVDEIAMNPAYFAVRSIRQSLSTLAHEMVHQWQYHHGKPGRRGYHNLEWADKMESVGLMPSDTGLPGGKRTGEQMTHYIVDGGPFDLACAELLTKEFTLSWLDRFPAERPAPPLPSSPRPSPISPLQPTSDPAMPEGEDGPVIDSIDIVAGVVLPPIEPVNRTNRLKYHCDDCRSQAWGKPGLQLFCGGQHIKRGTEIIDRSHSPKAMRVVGLSSSDGPRERTETG